MDWKVSVYLWSRFIVNRLSQHVEHTSQCCFTDRYSNRCAGTNRFHTTYKTICRSHRDTTNGVIP